jgi:hypothetical protein
MLKRALKRQATDLDSAGDTTMIELNNESLRDIVLYKGSYLGCSRKRALVNSAAIINSSNAVFKRYFKI